MLSSLPRAYNRSKIPLYLQVASVLRDRIACRQWAAGTKIPAIPELEREFGVARVTVRLAVGVLQEEGLVKARQGLGTFVSKSLDEKYSIKLATSWREMIKALENNVPHRVAVELSASPPMLSAQDGRLAKSYVRLQSVQYQNEQPYSAVTVWLSREVFKRNTLSFRKSAALVGIHRLGIPIQSSYQTLTVGSANVELAEVLKVPLGAPTLNTHIVVRDRSDTAIYVSDVAYRSESIELKISLLDKTPESGSKTRTSSSTSPRTAKKL